MDAHLDALTSVCHFLDYPGPQFFPAVTDCLDKVTAVDSIAAAKIHEFGKRTSGLALTELEELYIQTFDMNATCTLDLGWQLFGEDYNRGLFLVKIRQEMKRLGIPESHELPDHMSNVLKVLSRMEPDKAEDFAVSCVLPAVEKTCNAINESCLYRPLMEAVVQLLSVAYAETVKEASDGALV